MKKVCRGEAHRNPGGSPTFETNDFPHDTFDFEDEDGICGPGVTAYIWAEVNTETNKAVFWAEDDEA